MENGHKWSWKLLENAHKKVLESHGKQLSVFCMQPVKETHFTFDSIACYCGFVVAK